MSTPAPGRSCAGCTMCCKLLEIGALNKPPGQWCPHCKVGEGCAIYETRPDECRSFNCLWLSDASIPEEWAPRNTRMVLAGAGAAIFVLVDPSRAGAWRNAPYHAKLRGWAAGMVPRGGQILVREGREMFAILPDHEKALGHVEEGLVFLTTQRQTPNGTQYDMEVVSPDDPRAVAVMKKP